MTIAPDDGWNQGSTLGETLEMQARIRGRAPSLVCGGQRLSYSEFNDRVERVAALLESRGVERGSMVVWLGQNCHRVLEVLMAAGTIGAIFAPLNWRLTTKDWDFLLDDLDPKVVFWQKEDLGGRVSELLPNHGHRAWICHDALGPNSYESLLSQSNHSTDDRLVREDDPVLLIYTAAFEGVPSGALISHRAIVTQNIVLGFHRRLSSADVYLNSGPMFHVGTLMGALATVHSGGTNVVMRRMEPALACKLIQQERCSGAFIVEPTMSAMALIAREQRIDLSSLRWARTGTPWDELVTIDPNAAAGGYGQTEVMGLLSMNLPGVSAIGSHGWPSPAASIRVVGENDQDVPIGEVGEILARGPLVMCGYHNRDELNQVRFRNGWYHTNDLGRLETDGSLTFVAPKGRMMKSGSENIYPAEVELCIRQHPGVLDCAVIGVPDQQWVQSVKAIVVPKPDYGVTTSDVIDQCTRRLASYKKPKYVEFVDALPRRDGIVDYLALEAQFGGGGYPGAGLTVNEDAETTGGRK
jgi:long-chain acyl-CoA synthetase